MIMEKKDLRRKARDLEAVIRIGKKGVTESTIIEITKHLKKRKLIKIDRKSVV